MLDLKHRLKASHGYPVDSQQFTFSSGIPGDPSEQVEDARRVQEFATRSGILRALAVEASQPYQVRYAHRDGPGNAKLLRKAALS